MIQCDFFFFCFASRFLCLGGGEGWGWGGVVYNFFKMSGVFGSSVTSSLCDVCQCNPAPVL